MKELLSAERPSLETVDYGEMRSIQKWKVRATKRCCWKCGKPLKRGHQINKSGLCRHCSCIANGRKRLGCGKPERP